MKHIITFCDYFLPGFKAGGPVRSISNLITRLGDDLRFSVVTRDRDLGDDTSYRGIEPNRWQEREAARVLYLSPDRLRMATYRTLLRENDHDVVYLNSFLSPAFTIPTLALRRLRQTPRVPVVLAPRGEFSGGALRFSRFKKAVYMRAARWAGLYRGLTWHASNERERSDILRWLPRSEADRVKVVPPVPPGDGAGATKNTGAIRKRPGELDVVFLSRISPMKNLEGALGALRSLRGDVRFHLYGPREDSSYWRTCERLIGTLPRNVRVTVHGPVDADEVRATLARHDVFLLPTRGENFGHVVLEALLAGCPPIISDRTPWKNLRKLGVGWDLPLEDPGTFTSALQECVDMGLEEYLGMSRAARDHAVAYVNDEAILERSRRLFLEAGD